MVVFKCGSAVCARPKVALKKTACGFCCGRPWDEAAEGWCARSCCFCLSWLSLTENDLWGATVLSVLARVLIF